MISNRTRAKNFQVPETCKDHRKTMLGQEEEVELRNDVKEKLKERRQKEGKMVICCHKERKKSVCHQELDDENWW